MGDADNYTLVLNRDKVPPTGPHETKTFAARCHCRGVQFNVTLPTAVLPLRSIICNCSICRRTHGSFGSFHVFLPPGVAPQWTNGPPEEKLKGYARPGVEGERLFCPTCGTHVGSWSIKNQQWAVAYPLFDEKFWKLRFHAYPKSANGEGSVEWLPEVGGQEVLHTGAPERDFFSPSKMEVGPDGQERLRAECYCGGVSFTIPRPSQEVLQDDYMKKYVSPSDPKKWKAFLDLCRDCGRLTGANVVPWLLVPRVVLEPEMPSDLAFGTMKTYQSSGPNTRGFCGDCGATVLIKTTHRMPSEHQTVLNIAMGIVRAPEGVNATDWVTWRAGKPSWADDARKFDDDFTDALVEAHKDWSIGKYGDAPEFDVIYF